MIIKYCLTKFYRARIFVSLMETQRPLMWWKLLLQNKFCGFLWLQSSWNCAMILNKNMKSHLQCLSGLILSYHGLETFTRQNSFKCDYDANLLDV